MSRRRLLRRPFIEVSALVLLLSGVAADPAALADHDGEDQDSLTYEPHAGYAPAPPRAPGRLAPATGALMGTHSHDDDDIEPENQGIVQLEKTLGRTMDINNRYYGEFEEFAEEGTMSWMEKWDVESGRIPLVGWGCTYSDKINSGSLDDVIRKTAQVMKAFGHEFFMRYCWEMDGSRKQGEVKGPAKFIQAWRRMHGIFQAEGATNVIWVWTPNAAGFKDKRSYSNNEPPGPHFYPGDEYVDWIAADGYNWGVSKRNQGDRWRHFIEIFDEFMIFARQHPKPIMIGEYGVQEQPDDPQAKPDWFKAAHEVMMDKPRTPECPWCGAYSDVAAIVYFDVDYGKHGDWRIMSSEASTAAYRIASDDPWFHQATTINWPPVVNRSQPGSVPAQSTDAPPEPKDQPASSSEPPDEPAPAPEAQADQPAAGQDQDQAPADEPAPRAEKKAKKGDRKAA